MTDKDELFKGIEDAANNLFDQYVVKKPASPASIPSPDLDLGLEQKPEPSPAPVQPKSEMPPVPASPPEPELEFFTEPETGASPGEGERLFGQLEEALLTIDWEINHRNLLKGREILAKLVASKGWPATSTVGQLTQQMDKVLASMLESPERSPVSAPSQLKNALQVIREACGDNATPDEAGTKLLKTAISNLDSLLSAESSEDGYPSHNISDDLQAATPVGSVSKTTQVPAFDLGLEMDIEAGEGPTFRGEKIATTTANVLRAYATGINESIRLLTPMENLFASRPAMEKLLSAAKHLKMQLIDQQNLLGETFSSDYSYYNGLGTVPGWLESQLDVLKSCISRITKLEKLFSKTAGYEKLFTRSKKIRQTLEKQADAIIVAVGGTPIQHQFDLTGEYPAVIQPISAKKKEAPAAAISAVASPEVMVDKCITLAKSIELNTTTDPQKTGLNIREILEKLKIALSGSVVHSPGAMAAANAAVSVAGHSAKCRWDWVLKTSWGGHLIGIAPEQVVFESKSTFPVSTFKDMTFFSLKKLKSMPWTNLQGLFSGELAEIDNATLNEMELEIASPPSSFPGSSKKKVYLAILYTGGTGKVYLLDSPTEAISVSEEALWAPGTSSQSDIAGTLTVYGSTMPVVSID